MIDATTIDLGKTRSWTNEEARRARQLVLAEEALELHCEILELVEQERQGKFGMVMRLGRMHRDALWKHLELASSFEDYAVKFGAATCHTTARQMALLAEQLESLHELRAVLQAGRADWTKVRDAALAAIEKPEDEPFWVEEVQRSSGDVVRRKSQEARGLTPTKRTTFDLPLEVDALWDHYRTVVGQRLGRPITKIESMRHLLVSALRGEDWRDALEPELATIETAPVHTTPSSAPAESVTTEPSPAQAESVTTEPSPAPTEATSSELAPAPTEPRPIEPSPTEATSSELAPAPTEAASSELVPAEPVAKSSKKSAPARVPNPAALLHLHECRTCRKVEIGSSTGPVTLSLGLTATFHDDAFVQDAEGNVSRTIPAKTRRRIFARDRGTCVVPGCGARGFLDTHHEGERGWKGTGHDEDRMFLLCSQHHTLRHEGWLRIDGLVSTGLRWFNASGKELFGPESSTWWPAPPASSSTEVAVAITAGHTRVRYGEPVSPVALGVTATGHATDAVRDARLGLHRTGLSLKQADTLIGVVLSQLPANATASEIAAAAFRAMH